VLNSLDAHNPISTLIWIWRGEVFLAGLISTPLTNSAQAANLLLYKGFCGGSALLPHALGSALNCSVTPFTGVEEWSAL
jgi:hypothetical protein